MSEPDSLEQPHADLVVDSVTTGNVMRITNPIEHPITFHQGGRWIMKVDPQGHIELNTDVPQDKLVRDFVALCNQLRQSTRINRLFMRGIGRVADNPQALMLYFDRRPSDDEVRHIHEEFRDGTL